MLYNTACICEYAGSAYAGWQRQKNGKGIQEVIENILSEIYNEPIKIAGSGRTDAGVHALGQVFSFKSSIRRDIGILTKALNRLLPKDIVVLGSIEVDDTFHAGRSVISKTYEYKILNRVIPSAFQTDRALWVRRHIDMDKFQEALGYFVGKKDFAAFCVKKTKKDYTVRTINFANAYKSGDYITVEINADGFLHNMVRIITGTCIKLVTTGEDLSIIDSMVGSLDRRQAGPTAPAYALYQKEVFYNSSGISGLDGIGR